MVARPFPATPPLAGLDTFAANGDLQVIIETVKGRRSKLKYDVAQGVFRVTDVLPATMTFPSDFGFVPSTLGGDGDPLDAVIFLDEPAFPGCLAWARPIGVLEAEHTKHGQTVRNDRLIVVASESQDYSQVQSLEQLRPYMLTEIEQFFVTFATHKGEVFKPLGLAGAERARVIIDQARERYRARHEAA